MAHHGLITVPASCRRSAIYWLRLYRGSPSAVAILTEVPGNPGQSVTNAMDELIDHVARAFGASPKRMHVFEIWPRGLPMPGVPSVRRVTHRETSHWEDSSRSEIERVIGGPLPELPAHDELYRRVLSLGGGVTQEIWRLVFEPFRVSKLPPPHNLSRCQHADRFRRMSKTRATRAGVLAAGRRFLASLAAADLQSCRFHRADWKTIADASVAVLRRVGRADQEDYVAAARRVRLPTANREWLISLFDDPVIVSDGRYTNGQHRGCALRFSGAERAAVVVREELLRTGCVDWTYAGDG